MRLLLICLVMAGLGQPGAAQRIPDPAFDYCITEDTDYAGRQQSIEDWHRSLHLILEYGKAKGYYTEDGEVDFKKLVIEPILTWRSLVGLPPEDPFARCLSRGGGQFFGPTDYREIWACLVEHDPDAAKMDAI